MKFRFLIPIVLFVIKLSYSQDATPSIYLETSIESLSLVHKMSIIKDEKYSIKQAIELFNNNKGQRINKDKVGVSKGTYWVYFKINTKEANNYYFTIKGWTTSFFQFYIKEKNDINFDEKLNWEDNRYFKNKRVINDFSLKTHFKENSEYTCLLKISYPRNIYIPLHIESETHFLQKKLNQQLKNGVIYGCYALLFFIVLFLYYQLRDSIYFYYGGVAISTLGHIMLQDGILYEWFKNDINLYILEWFLVISYSFFTTFFVEKFNNVKEYYPKLYKAFIVLFITISVSITLFFATDNYIFYLIGNYLKDFSFIFFWIITLVLFNREPYIKYYSITYSIYIFSCFLFLLSFNLGFNTISIDSLKLIATVKMFIVCGLTIYRFKYINEENEQLTLEKLILTKRTDVLVNEKEKLLNEKGNLMQELSHKNEILTSIKSRENNTSDFSQKREKVYQLFDLTKRELDILEKIYLGKPNKKIAEELNVSLSTVKQYSSRIYKKLNVTSRVNLITFLEKM